jgi:hypothetical protein
MAKKERFGKFVLLEEIESSGLGTEHRAAKLGSGGLEKIVTVLRLGTSFSANADAAKALMEQAKVAAQLQTPNIIKILGIGKSEGTYYISYEFVEGKSLKSIFGRCRQESFPLSVDHALLIASKICSALEYAHNRRIEGAGRYYHGFLTPGNVVVSYEGELRVRGFGYWLAHIREAGAVAEDDLLYLAPEQVGGQGADTRSDIFSVAAILFEALTGHPLFEGGRTTDIPARLALARLQNPTGDDDALPRPLSDILSRALSVDPGGRYGEVQELRKAVDTLLFSGDFTPTTFNLAFFMHSLFREDIEREGRALKQEREASYFDYLQEEAPKAPAAAAAPIPPAFMTPAPSPMPHMPTPAPVPAVTPGALPLIPPPPRRPTPAPVRPTPTPFTTPAPVARTGMTPVPPTVAMEPGAAEPSLSSILRAATPEPAIVVTEAPAPKRELTVSGPILSHGGEPKKRGMGLIIAAIVGVIAIGAGVGYYFYKKPSGPPPPTAAEIEKMRQDLEAARAREAALEKEKQDAIEKARQDALAEAERNNLAAAQAKKLADAAAEKARKEQELRQQQERDRLAAEQARIEQERLAAEQAEKERQEREEAARRAAATPPPTPTAVPTPTPPPPIYSSTDPGIIPPVSECPKITLPPVARALKISGQVRLLVTIDARNRVSDVRVLGGPDPLKQPAVDFIKSCKWRSATKDGAPVRVNHVVGVTYPRM